MPGEALRIDIEQNTGIHTFVIDEIGLKQQVNAGSSFEFTAPTEPGDYVFYCDVGSHRELGMEGILRVADVLEAVTIRDPIADPVDTAE